MRKWLTILPAAMLALGIQTAYADDDKKSVMGNVCVPSNYKQDDDFRYKNGGIFNASKKKRRNVDCPLLRDRFSADSTAELDVVVVYVNHWSKAKKPFQCIVFVRDLVTGAVLASGTAQTSANGNQTLNLGGHEYPNPTFDNRSLYVRCKVPPRGTVRGIYWEEDLFTDSGEGE